MIFQGNSKDDVYKNLYKGIITCKNDHQGNLHQK